MPNIADQIFGAFAQASHVILKQDAIRKKQEQIRSILISECGNCAKWMTSNCKPEKERGLFKTMSSQGCGEFTLSHGSELLRDVFTKELAELQQDKEIQCSTSG